MKQLFSIPQLAGAAATVAFILFTPSFAGAAPKPVGTAWQPDYARCGGLEYPKEAQRQEHMGMVVLEFLIRPDGSVVTSRIVTSSGYAELDNATQEGLSRCPFKARDGQTFSEDTWTRVRYIWTLE